MLERNQNVCMKHVVNDMIVILIFNVYEVLSIFKEWSLVFTCLFIINGVLMYINHSRPLISDGVHLILDEVWEEREARPILICWALRKEASGTIFIKCFCYDSVEHMTSRSLGERSTTKSQESLSYRFKHQKACYWWGTICVDQAQIQCSVK